MRLSFRGLTVLVALLAGACTSLIGVRDIHLDENINAGGGDGGARDGDTADGRTGEGGDPDAPITCEADLQSDPKHCGACGHDCTNGVCDTGICILAQDLKSPHSIAVRGTTIFVSQLGGNFGSVLSCPTTGCASATVGTKLLTSDAGDPYPYYLVATDTHVWTSDYLSGNNGGVRRILTTGGDFRRFPTSPAVLERSYAVAVDKTSVYWTTNASPGSVQWCNLPDCANGLQTAVASADSAELIVVAADGSIIWAENGGGILKRCNSKTACTPALLVPDYEGVVNDLKLDGDTVYFGTNLGEILSCSVKGCANAKKIVLEDPKATIAAIAVSGNDVFWSSMEFAPDGNNVLEEQGKIKTCTMPKCSGADIRVIATNQHDPVTMTLDAKSVYWANSGKRFNSGGTGNLYKAAR